MSWWTAFKTGLGNTKAGSSLVGKGLRMGGKGLYRAISPNSRGYSSLLGRGAVAGMGFAASGILDSYLETQHAKENLNLAQRIGLNIGSGALSLFGYAQLARGVAGTALRGTEAASNRWMAARKGGATPAQIRLNSMKIKSSAKSVDNFLSFNPLRAKSMGRYATKGAWAVAKGTMRFGARLVPGTIGAGLMPIRAVGAAIGSMPGIAGSRIGRAIGGGQSFHSLMLPKMPRLMPERWSTGIRNKLRIPNLGILNEARHVPMNTGFIGLGLAGGAMRAWNSYNYQNSNWSGGRGNRGGMGIDPNNFGGGIMYARRGMAARNFDMATTLSLHRSHSRILN